MLLNFESFNKIKNSEEGKQDYFVTRIAIAKKIKACCECLFTIAIGEEHHQAIGFWDAEYSDRRTCLKCYALLIELENTSARIDSMNDFHFGSFHERLKRLRSHHPDEFAAFEDEFDLSDIIKRIKKKKGWRDVPMQCHAKIKIDSGFIYCCQCSWEMPPKTRYEDATITEDHEVKYVSKTCLKCVEKRKDLDAYFFVIGQYNKEHHLLFAHRKSSISCVLRRLSNSIELAKITDLNVLKLINTYIEANKRFEHEAEEEFEYEAEKRKSGIIPPTTPYEFKLKASLEHLGYEVIHNQALGYYFPDLLIRDHGCIVEVDGNYHLSSYQQAKDTYRTEYLNKQGYFVIRVSNDRVGCDLETLLKELKTAIVNKENLHLG